LDKGELIVATVWLSLGITIGLLSYELKLGTFKSPGPGLLPLFLGLALSLLSILTILRKLFFEGRELNKNQEPKSKIDVRKTKFILCCLLAYAILLERIGFVITTFIVLFLLFKTIGPFKFRNAFVWSLLTVAVSYVTFVIFLGVQLPSGIFRISWIR